jgi:hypothetical protein
MGAWTPSGLEKIIVGRLAMDPARRRVDDGGRALAGFSRGPGATLKEARMNPGAGRPALAAGAAPRGVGGAFDMGLCRAAPSAHEGK